MIEKVSIDGFKNLKKNEIRKFSPKINLLIGSNGSGKSNFLDSISLFKEIVIRNSLSSIMERGGEDIANKENRSIKFSIQMGIQWEYKNQVRISNLLYSSSYQVLGTTPFFYNEHLSEAQSKPFKYLVRDGNKCMVKFKSGKKIVKLDPHKSFFEQTERIINQLYLTEKQFPLFLRQFERIKQEVERWKHFRNSYVSLADLRRPQKATGRNESLLEDFSNFGDVMLKIGTDPQFLSKIKKILKKDIRFEIRMEGTYIIIQPIVYNRKFSSLNALSDGEMRIILLLLMLLSKNGNQQKGVLLIDEPELNLHPSWLLQLRNEFLESDNQIFISTHSAELLDVFTEDFINKRISIFVFENGKMEELKMTPSLKMEIENGYELGDLYRMGDPVIGGWK